MQAIEQFRETVLAAIGTATSAGANQDQLHAVLLELGGLDRATARDAAESLDQLIDGEQDDLAEQLAPARDLLRRVAGGSTA
jgi:hypothetical protein